MNNLNKDFIQYYGINTFSVDTEIQNFKQQNIDSNFNIPPNKAEIDEILKVWLDASIIDYEVINTSKGVSLEHQRMTGFNIFATGDMKLKIEYVSNDKYKYVHTIRTVFPFSTFLDLPGSLNPSSSVYPIISIEDILVKKISAQCIYINVTFIFTVDIW